MIQRKVLSDAFQAALQGWRLRAGVFLTFRFNPGFFEQDILPIFFDIPMSHAPIARVLHLADALRSAGVSVEWAKVSSAKGHDAFLTEPALFDEVLRRALA